MGSIRESVTITAKGSYHIGGKKVTIEGSAPRTMHFWAGGPAFTYDPNGDFQAGQMYVQYTRLADPVLPYPVCMIHGGGASGVLWASPWRCRRMRNAALICCRVEENSLTN